MNMPFIFLYGMWEYGVLAAVPLGGGITLGMIMPNQFITGGWLAGVALIVFGSIAGRLSEREQSWVSKQSVGCLDLALYAAAQQAVRPSSRASNAARNFFDK